jgi:ferredoxin-NADP reductase
MPIEARWTTAVIAGITDVAADVREFTLMPDGGCASFTPGSHIDVEITTADGRHLRSYSLVGEPGPVLRIAVKRQSHGRGGSRAMWSLAVGDQIRATARCSRRCRPRASTLPRTVCAGSAGCVW